MEGFSKDVQEKLGHYVYGLIDPRNGRYFYIGKGQRNRVFEHVEEARNPKETSNKYKIQTIRDIQEDGLEIQHIIIRHGLNDDEARLVEAVLIDFIGIDNLTNIADGEGNSDCGIDNAKTLQKKYSTEEFEENADTPHFIMIKINQENLEKRNKDYYETCRAAWKIDTEKAKKYPLVLCVLDQIVKEVYEVDNNGDAWKPVAERPGRYEFTAKQAPEEISKLFKDKRIPAHYRQKGLASPVLYYPR